MNCFCQAIYADLDQLYGISYALDDFVGIGKRSAGKQMCGITRRRFLSSGFSSGSPPESTNYAESEMVSTS
jgi:hypothetical protein